jgi:hypothetical protein
MSHIGGKLLRSRLETKIGQVLEKDIPAISSARKVPHPNEEEKGVLTQMLVRKALDSHRWDADELRRLVERREGMNFDAA